MSSVVGVSEQVATADAATAAPLETELRAPYDWRSAVLHQQRGPGDPTMVAVGRVVWRASRTPEGVATLALREVSPGAVRAAAWGPGAAWALEQLPALCGGRDDTAGFDPGDHPLVREVHRRNPGLRIGRTDLVFDALVTAIMEQKVTATQAFGAWRRLVTRHGERAPGPTPRPMYAPPTVGGWRGIPSWEWHRAGLEPPQSRTIVEAARTFERWSGRERTTAEALTSIRGIGVWTAAETRIRALGDPDAVSVGDYHLAHQVGYILTGERADDERMLHLLSPWIGHRQRVIRLLLRSGIVEPRRGPRVHPEDHRRR